MFVLLLCSVSDLLDYINPNPDAKGKDVAAGKRRSYIMKVLAVRHYLDAANRVFCSLYLWPRTIERNLYFQVKGKIHPSSCEESPKEGENKASDEETCVSKPEDKPDANQEVSSLPAQDDGWKHVQRLRASVSLGRRLKQRRVTIGKVFSSQKKNVEPDMEFPLVKASHQNIRYYRLKKRTIAHGGHVEQHTINPSQGSKFGRGIIKTVAYQVKSTPSTKSSTEISRNAGEVFNSPGESASTFGPNDHWPTKHSIVSLGKSPSYKEVALAPPDKMNETKNNFEQLTTGMENIYEKKSGNNVVDSTDNPKGEITVENKEETMPTTVMEDSSCLTVSERVEGQELEAGDHEVHEVVQDGIFINSMLDSINSPNKELCEKDLPGGFEPHSNLNSTLQGLEELKDKPLVLNYDNCHGLANKKLSASATPFNPSTSISRASLLPLNITLPPIPVPAVAPWAVNMPLHPAPPTVLPNPICSSPHYPYPSPPPTPSMIQSLPFIQFSWQCNVNPSVPEFNPGTVWPSHPMEISVPSPIVEPISDRILKPKMQGDDTNPTSAPMLPLDIDTIEEAKKEVNISASEAINSLKIIRNMVEETNFDQLYKGKDISFLLHGNKWKTPFGYVI
ncbi:Tetratricopeptide repeat (TPR)-like superfamily protein, putative isoform 2 [Hibiscus syriacus]|uniref:Tetratricopeptide repeat (TPR)-like superfamily protein, putative isoform 2 n=1 Tax=Hibiscus syriacus TaxID=106335 RepID=A0A6A2YH91_HIBSY|nr:Tetratricopeptide repeat (TPR)-like superfamily protein, putative isoform 2 [Hibiscus syriacus]